MRKGRRERIEKGSIERIEKRERDKKIRREGGPEIRPCNVAIVSSSPQGMTSRSSSIKMWFIPAYRCIIQNNMSWCETECKNMCHW